jgi:hypothetical protein
MSETVDRNTPAVRLLAALADVDPRTAASWLNGESVRPGNEERLRAALPRAREGCPEGREIYDRAPAGAAA